MKASSVYSNNQPSVWKHVVRQLKLSDIFILGISHISIKNHKKLKKKYFSLLKRKDMQMTLFIVNKYVHRLIRTRRKLSKQNVISLLDSNTVTRVLVVRRESSRVSRFGGHAGGIHFLLDSLVSQICCSLYVYTLRV